MLLAGMELKTIADQLGHSSVVLTAETYLSAAGALLPCSLKSLPDPQASDDAP
jgi:hypothetical protein